MMESEEDRNPQEQLRVLGDSAVLIDIFEIFDHEELDIYLLGEFTRIDWPVEVLTLGDLRRLHREEIACLLDPEVADAFLKWLDLVCEEFNLEPPREGIIRGFAFLPISNN